MVRNIAFLCAAVTAFGITLERPNNLAEARRRCCYQYRYSNNCCQSGYQTYGYQNQYAAGYQNPYVNQCGQTYDGNQYQGAPRTGEVNAPAPAPSPAPAADNHSTYYRNGTNTPNTRPNGTATPSPAPATRDAAPATTTPPAPPAPQ